MALTYKQIIGLIRREEKAHKCYRDQAKEAADAARDDGDPKNSYNLTWSNNLIIRSAIFASMPLPDVRRRYRSEPGDPAAQELAREEKQLATLIERAISYQSDVNDYETPAKAVVKNLVDEGLGVPRVVYDVQTKPIPDLPDEEGEEDGESEDHEEIVSQDVSIEYWPAKYFHWEPGRTAWTAVNWIAYESFIPVKEVESEYKVTIKSGSSEKDGRKENDYAREVCVYEFWHKPSRTVYIVSDAHDKILDKYEDPLHLKGFYPSPRPVFANLKSDELLPKPDYQFIEFQISELNRITTRIKAIAGQIKALGYYDSELEGLADLMSESDGTLKPVPNLASFLASHTGKADYSNAIAYLPLQEKIITLRELQAQRRETKEEVFEILGISDIVRGVSDSSETATAQQIKGQWAGVRLRDKIDDVARLWRDVFRMIAEIMCEHFKPEQLTMMTGIALTPNMIEIMRSDIGRSFSIDIETDSTIAGDDQAERQDIMELINVLGDLMQKYIPGVQQGAMPPNVLIEMLTLAISRYKNAKALEDAVAEIGPHLQGLQQFQQQMQQMQQALQQRDQQLQQAGQQVQGMQKQLQGFNEREEVRKDKETKAKVRAEMANAEAQEIENAAVKMKLQQEAA